MSKKISIIVIVILVIACACLTYYSISLNKEIKSLKKEPEEVDILDGLKTINGVNFKELIEDMEAIKTGNVVNAKLDENSTSLGASKKYLGEGYYVVKDSGGDAVGYRIFVNDEEVWQYVMRCPITVGNGE